ncbi:MAG: DUF58 domain-containing protein [Candidatus Dormibacteria bacterium]
MDGAAAAAASLGLTPDLLRRLDLVSVRARRPVLGRGAGERLSPRPGSSVEFADFRTYVPGDDFRRLDWNAFGRLDKLLLKLYLGEEDLALNLWVDTSASMDYGTPQKAAVARTLAGALAYVGLAGYDRVSTCGFADRLHSIGPSRRGRAAATFLWRALTAMPAGGATDFRCLRARGRVPRGLSVVISDFLGDSPPGPALAGLRQSGQELVLIQVVSPEEVNPTISGDVALRDLETGAIVEVTAGAPLLSAYREALRAHQARLAALAGAHGALLVQVSTAESPAQALLGTLRRAGVLQ